MAVRVGREFFDQPVPDVAVALLGSTLCFVQNGEVVSGRIVETEAYLDETDLASHASWSRIGRQMMLQDAGTIYMYRAYGIHAMFNLVCGGVDVPGAVLIRALEPCAGITSMEARRPIADGSKIASGPGNACKALGLELDLNGRNLATDPDVWLEGGSTPDLILNSKRVGITKSADLLLRFFDGQSRSVSASRRGVDWSQRDSAAAPQRSISVPARAS